MAIRISYNGAAAAQTFRANMFASRARMQRAIARSADDAALNIKHRGDINIMNSGNFGRRWTNAFFAQMTQTAGRLANARITVGFREIWYAHIHEFGGTIRPRLPSLQHGVPLLWIPLSFTGVRIRAREWARQHGGLFRVDRRQGRPLLLSIRTGQPMYFGIEQVTIRPRWRLRAICREVMAGFPQLYRNNFRRDRGGARRGR